MFNYTFCFTLYMFVSHYTFFSIVYFLFLNIHLVFSSPGVGRQQPARNHRCAARVLRHSGRPPRRRRRARLPARRSRRRAPGLLGFFHSHSVSRPRRRPRRYATSTESGSDRGGGIAKTSVTTLTRITGITNIARLGLTVIIRISPSRLGIPESTEFARHLVLAY